MIPLQTAIIRLNTCEAADLNSSFLHLPDVDAAGHQNGWGSAQRVATIEHADVQLARIFAAQERAGIGASTVVILSADHGGAGFSHGADDARSRYIPWLMVGPGVKRGHNLTQSAELAVRTEDSAATICHLLGLPQQKYFGGKPLLAAFE